MTIYSGDQSGGYFACASSLAQIDTLQCHDLSPNQPAIGHVEPATGFQNAMDNLAFYHDILAGFDFSIHQILGMNGAVHDNLMSARSGNALIHVKVSPRVNIRRFNRTMNIDIALGFHPGPRKHVP